MIVAMDVVSKVSSWVEKNHENMHKQHHGTVSFGFQQARLSAGPWSIAQSSPSMSSQHRRAIVQWPLETPS